VKLVSCLAGKLPEESEQFRFLRTTHLVNLKGSVGLISVKDSAMRVAVLYKNLDRPSVICPDQILGRAQRIGSLPRVLYPDHKLGAKQIVRTLSRNQLQQVHMDARISFSGPSCEFRQIPPSFSSSPVQWQGLQWQGFV